MSKCLNETVHSCKNQNSFLPSKKKRLYYFSNLSKRSQWAQPHKINKVCIYPHKLGGSDGIGRAGCEAKVVSVEGRDLAPGTPGGHWDVGMRGTKPEAAPPHRPQMNPLRASRCRRVLPSLWEPRSSTALRLSVCPPPPARLTSCPSARQLCPSLQNLQQLPASTAGSWAPRALASSPGLGAHSLASPGGIIWARAWAAGVLAQAPLAIQTQAQA